MLNLGIHQAGTAYVSFFEQQIPRLLLGYFWGPALVGQYAFVMRIRFAIQDVLIQPFLYIVYPSFVEIRNNIREKNKIFRLLTKFLGGVLFPASLGAIVLAPTYILLFFGEKWVETVSVLQIFLLSTITLSFNIFIRDLLRAHKKVKYYLKIQSLLVLIGIILCFFLVQYGLYIVMVGHVVMSAIATICYSIILKKRADLSLLGNIFSLIPPILASSVMAFLLAYISYGVCFNEFFMLIVDVFIGASVYGVLLMIFDRRAMINIIRLIRNKSH